VKSSHRLVFPLLSLPPFEKRPRCDGSAAAQSIARLDLDLSPHRFRRTLKSHLVFKHLSGWTRPSHPSQIANENLRRYAVLNESAGPFPRQISQDAKLLNFAMLRGESREPLIAPPVSYNPINLAHWQLGQQPNQEGDQIAVSPNSLTSLACSRS
jgi:hypothetical protein